MLGHGEGDASWTPSTLPGARGCSVTGGLNTPTTGEAQGSTFTCTSCQDATLTWPVGAGRRGRGGPGEGGGGAESTGVAGTEGGGGAGAGGALSSQETGSAKAIQGPWPLTDSPVSFHGVRCVEPAEGALPVVPPERSPSGPSAGSAGTSQSKVCTTPPPHTLLHKYFV